MLFDATAALVASLTVAAVAGPSVVAENVPAFSPSSITSGAATDMVPTLEGTDVLRTLAAMPPTAVADFVGAHPQQLAAVLAAQPGARQVSGWWAQLDATAQRAIAGAAPELVGNLDGVPYAVRNDVNRGELRQAIRELELGAASPGRTAASQTVQRVQTVQTVQPSEPLHGLHGVEVLQDAQNQQRLQMLYSIADALGPATANPPRTLLTLDSRDQGKAAIVLGDLDTADYVSYVMPGMFITVGSSIVEWTDVAARLYDEQVSWLSLLAEVGASDESEEVATVAWIGYQTPHLLNVGSLDLAYEGRDAIASAIEGLLTVRGADRPFISLLAHSYGSTAAMLALEQNTTVDALAMIGSPGAPATSVRDLNVRGDVFVGEAAWDPIPNSSFFGSDPGSVEFGARAMSVAGTVDIITNRSLAASIGHNEYWSPGTESMRNLALIGIDKGELVTDGSQHDAGRTLALLR